MRMAGRYGAAPPHEAVRTRASLRPRILRESREPCLERRRGSRRRAARRPVRHRTASDRGGARHHRLGDVVRGRRPARCPPAGRWSPMDLRGRGPQRHGCPARTAWTAHAEDLNAASPGTSGARPVVLTGQSMGAYAALRAAAGAPTCSPGWCSSTGACRCRCLPAPTPTRCWRPRSARRSPGCARRSRREEAYVDFFRAHPALAGTGTTTWRSTSATTRSATRGRDALRVRQAGRRQDGRLAAQRREAFGDDAATRSKLPADLLCAPRGMFDQRAGMLPPTS